MRDMTAPLSFQQLEQLGNIERHPDCAHRYDLVCLFRLDGDVDVDCLDAAVADVIDRHAALRTVIGHTATGPVQLIAPRALDPLSVRRWPAGHTVEQVARTLLAERHGRDEVLSGRPLFRPALHRIGPVSLLSFTVHHLVYDGWCLPVLWRDLSRCYAARRAGTVPDLPPLRLTYADFARSRRRHWDRHGAEAVRVWRSVTGDCPPEVNWPAPLQPAPPGGSVETVTHTRTLDPGAAEAVGRAAKAARVTPFTILLTATALAISRVTGQHEVMMATDTANREDPAIRDLVGMCVNSRLSRVRAEPGVSPLELARGVWRSWRSAEPYRDCYIGQVLNALGSPYPLRVNTYELDEGEHEGPRFPGARVTPVPVSAAVRDWRDVTMRWGLGRGGYEVQVRRGVGRVDAATVDDLLDIMPIVLKEFHSDR